MPSLFGIVLREYAGWRGSASNKMLMTAPKKELRPALFLDRDGVINVDREYVCRVEDFEFVDGAPDVIRAFNKKGWRVFVVTNQTGIAQGFYTEKDMHTIHAHMEAELAKHDAYLDHIYFCPYHDDAQIERYRLMSDLRKPRPGMLLQAMRDYPTCLKSSFMIGDKTTDMAAAKAAGIGSHFFQGDNLQTFIDDIFDDQSRHLTSM